jgi:hypothetical protein
LLSGVTRRACRADGHSGLRLKPLPRNVRAREAGALMRHFRRPPPILSVAALAIALAGCATQAPPPPEPAAPSVVPTLPPAFPPQDLVGRWGLAAYHIEADRTRIEAAARQSCSQPYTITLGPSGGVMMHLADQATPTELALKGAPGGKTYIGPREDPPGSSQDRLVEVFDGRMLILHWMDPEVQGRYGNMVYVRCGAEGTKPKTAAKPKAKPPPTKPASKPPA